MTATNMLLCAARSLEGKYDLAYMNPLHYVFYYRESGHEATAKKEGKLLQCSGAHKDSIVSYCNFFRYHYYSSNKFSKNGYCYYTYRSGIINRTKF